MITTADLIREKLSLQNLAEGLYEMSYTSLWKRKMYNENKVFEQLRKKYGETPLNRQMIINLFKDENFYDGFLCAMTWGGIGSNVKGKAIFNSVFSKGNQKCISKKIKRVAQILNDESKESEERIRIAYLSLVDKNENGIEGIGESFYTKILFFVGAGIESLTLKPLIYDRHMKDAYQNLLDKPITKAEQPIEQYIDYCRKMEVLREQLNFPSSGHVEALLFQPTIRRVIFGYEERNDEESLTH